MNCAEFRTRLHPYVDGELPVSETAAADAHGVECRACAELARSEREFRRVLRRQPRDVAPPELRARIVGRVRRQARWRSVPGRLAAPALAAAAAAVLVAVLLPLARPAPSLVSALVDKHIAYAQVERPAELASSDPAEVAAWFRQRAGLRVTVPDYSMAGIRLVGARIADAQERQAAYLLYEKGMTLLSVFMVPAGVAEVELPGSRVTYRDHQYATYERKGYRTVSWTDGQAVYGLVSMLDYQALLECADKLRLERASQMRLWRRPTAGRHSSHRPAGFRHAGGGWEPVLAVTVNGDARAYPLQILMWHEIVNDVIGGVPAWAAFNPDTTIHPAR